MGMSSGLYVAFVFCGILFVVDTYPEKRYGKNISFLHKCKYMHKLNVRACFCNELFGDSIKEM